MVPNPHLEPRGIEEGYRILFQMTSQLLDAGNFDQQLSLALDTVLSLGYRQAAVALLDREADELRIRAAVGFADGAEGIRWPCETGAAWSYPLWLGNGADFGASGDLAERLGCEDDLLSLPVSGALQQAGTGRVLLGILLIGASRPKTTPPRFELLVHLANRVGSVLATAERYEQVSRKVTTLEWERRWVDAILNSVADPIVLTNLENEILLQNRRAEEFLTAPEGAGEGRLRALKVNDLLFSAYLSSAGFSVSKVRRGDLTLVDPIEGTDVHFEVVSTPTFDENMRTIGFVSIFRNVTDLRRAHEEMLLNYRQIAEAETVAGRERDRLERIIENVGDPIVVSDSSGEIILYNRRAEAFFYDRDASWGETGSVRANSVKLTSFITSFASEFSTTRKTEVHFVNPATNELLPMEITAVKIADTRGQMTTIVSILHDLSEMRELERRRVEQKLLESQKLAAIGRLTATLAHEINNPLEAIKNSLYLQRESEDQETQRKFLDIAFKETQRMSHTVTRMLGFARSSGHAEDVDINALVEETLVLIEQKLKQSGVRLVRRMDKKVPKLRARPDQLRQVLLNVLLNAQQAIEGRGTIRVRVASTDSMPNPPWIVLEISDTGCGIKDEDRGRIFEPFFSTGKKGTGLGLWVSQDIVRLHGGQIEVLSELGKGTTFRILLPTKGGIQEESTTVEFGTEPFGA